jgi:NAD(P)-dependent dehydrogenase (short-subunit alcohol dehydrogenase family)
MFFLQTNYISHWLLTYHLLPLLLETARQTPAGYTRIVNVSSDGHLIFGAPSGIDFSDINQIKSGKGGPWSRYGSSKLANILHAKELNRRYGRLDTGSLWIASLHPGTVDT